MSGDPGARPQASDQDKATEALAASASSASASAGPSAFFDTVDVRPTVPLASQTQAQAQSEPLQPTLASTEFEYDDDHVTTTPFVRTRRIADETAELVDDEDGEAAAAAAPPDRQQLRRFGPGVPAATVPTEVAVIWHGSGEPGRKGRHRAVIGWLVPFVVLMVVLAILLWRRSGSPFTVTGASVRTAQTALSCGATATVIGTLRTNGEPGTIAYQWKRSDGTVSDVLEQRVAKGSHQVDVSLLWTFNGDGSLRATATLDVLNPTVVTAATTFDYTCVG
jgi:hypothetical protein